MKLFNLFRSSKGTVSSEDEEIVNWNRLTHIDQLERLMEISYTTPVLIFKHSTRCGISSMMLNSFRKNFDIGPDAIMAYYLDLLSFRDVSDEVAYRFQVLHQSPQILLIKNGVAVAHASHYEIQSLDLGKYF